MTRNDTLNKFYFEKGSHPLIGKRIRLIECKDKYTKLEAGALGTVTDVNYCSLYGEHFTQIGVNWDDGSRLMLIDRDRFEVIGEAK